MGIGKSIAYMDGIQEGFKLGILKDYKKYAKILGIEIEDTISGSNVDEVKDE